jgi:hypothetical protein
MIKAHLLEKHTVTKYILQSENICARENIGGDGSK